ncbi:metallophosphoesterase [Actinomycetospora corticicola]|uniref:3',5'-cyclic AMP phosphodiesterase CpdA n=1 Tax=Actinomycetospora corticicola TaxID=663602 RepID=A0A7Y9DRT7_9PSEU|nr:3',5'-cyclic AMP phosphodiesterase CpdA [Actinomycetospora corticicola]
MTGPRLLATSDLHVNRTDNQALVRDLHPSDPGDWLIVAGDVADKVADIRWALALLADRFEQVIWVPGNHDLWTPPGDDVQLVGPERYDHLVEVCRSLGVLTPEDAWPVFAGHLICPMFLLYDYSWRVRPDMAGLSVEDALAVAREAGVVATDEFLMASRPYDGPAAWCAARLTETRRRLSERPADLPTVLVNHWPLTELPLRVLRHPEFSLWCGTTETARWHVEHDAAAVVYGHLHVPRTTWEDGVRFEEVSVGYPREWQRHDLLRGPLRTILPAPEPEVPDPFTAWALRQGARWESVR